MGMMSTFLRVTGQKTLIDFCLWKKCQRGKGELLSAVEGIAQLKINTAHHLVQISQIHAKNLRIWCYLAQKKYKLAQDLVCLIASFLPIEFVSLSSLGEAQNKWKIHGY